MTRHEELVEAVDGCMEMVDPKRCRQIVNAVLALLSQPDPERVERLCIGVWPVALDAALRRVAELEAGLAEWKAATNRWSKRAAESERAAEKAEVELERLWKVEQAARTVLDAEEPSADFWEAVDALRAKCSEGGNP